MKQCHMDADRRRREPSAGGDVLFLRSGLWLVGLLFALSFTSGCGPKKIVAIPPEWRTPPPARQEAAPAKAAPLKREPSSSPAQPFVLQRSPEIKESDVPATTEAAPSAPPKKKEPDNPPERLASMHVVEQAKASLAQGNPDAAIPLLEKAIQIDVYNGEAFFGLARAWRMKGARQKALEFARKAEIIFQGDSRKLKEVYLFEADLCKEAGDVKKMEGYRQKASKL